MQQRSTAFRLRLLGFYHDFILQKVKAGIRPGLIHQAIVEDMRTGKNLQVSINGVKKYIYRHNGNWLDAFTIGWADVQRLTVPLSVSIPTLKPAVKADLGPKLKHMEYELPFAENWWVPLTVDSQKMFGLDADGWSLTLAKVMDPDPSSVGFLQYMAASVHARAGLGPETTQVAMALQELARLLTSKMRFSLMCDFSPILKGVMGFSVSFNRRDRGMNELQQFQKLPRWWRREVQVTGTMSGLFVPLGLEWSAEQTSSTEFAEIEVPKVSTSREWAFVEEIEYWKKMMKLTSKEADALWKVVPAEYSELVRDKAALTKGIYWKPF